MLSSLRDKMKLIKFVKGNIIIDVGCGDGMLMKKILESNESIKIYGIDPDEESCARTRNNGLNILNCYADELHYYFPQNSINTIITSSTIHEIFSYGNRDKNIGKIKNVEDFFDSVNYILKQNGIFIIRDGVCPEHGTDFMFTNDDHAVSKFLELSPFVSNKFDKQIKIDKVENGIYIGTRSSLMEFAYTYTWGIENFYREANEFYGVFTMKHMINFARMFGFKLLHFESYLQPEYVKNLTNVKLAKGFPDSNAIWVFEKE